MPAGTGSYVYNGLSRDQSIAALSGGYDARGNLANEGAGKRTFTYDVENRLTGVSGSASLSLAYDPIGRLQQTTSPTATTQFLYAGDQLIAEYNGSTVLYRYAPSGLGDDRPTVWYQGTGVNTRAWLHADNQGSVVFQSDATGAETAAFPYGAYGEPQAWSGERFRYTGQLMLPEAQLYFYKARVYDPMRGWFLQTDPAGYDADLDLYSYVDEDPVNKDDPSGLVSNPDPCGPRGCNQEWGASGCNASLPGGCDAAAAQAMMPAGAAHTGANGGARGSGWSNLSPNRSLEQQKADFAARQKVDVPVAEKQLGELGATLIGSGVADAGLAAVAGAVRLPAVARLVARTCGCFVAGTLVETPTGLRPIEQIKVGDLVRSRDESSGETAFKAVTGLLRPHDRRIYEVKLGQTGTGALAETFDVTDDHPWMSADGRWLTTLQLKPGGRVQTEDGKDVTVVSIVATSRIADTYNLEVSGFHTYFVGKERVWVHNAPCEKAASSIWRGLQNWRQGLKTDGNRIFSWDHLHNEIEVFTKRGEHLGAMDPETGQMIKDAVPGRTINVR